MYFNNVCLLVRQKWEVVSGGKLAGTLVNGSRMIAVGVFYGGKVSGEYLLIRNS